MRPAGGINTRALELAVPSLHGRLAADVGSGSGRVLDVLRLHDYAVVGCELDAERATLSRVDHADAFAWTPPSAVDVVTCLEVIEHVPQRRHRELLARMAGWLGDEGRLLVSTPQRNSPVSLFERAFHRVRPKHGPYTWWDPTHISIMGRRYWERLFRELGLTVERRIGCDFVPELVAMAIPPVARFRLAATDGPLAVFGFDLLWVLAPTR